MKLNLLKFTILNLVFSSPSVFAQYNSDDYVEPISVSIDDFGEAPQVVIDLITAGEIQSVPTKDDIFTVSYAYINATFNVNKTENFSGNYFEFLSYINEITAPKELTPTTDPSYTPQTSNITVSSLVDLNNLIQAPGEYGSDVNKVIDLNGEDPNTAKIKEVLTEALPNPDSINDNMTVEEYVNEMAAIESTLNSDHQKSHWALVGEDVDQDEDFVTDYELNSWIHDDVAMREKVLSLFKGIASDQLKGIIGPPIVPCPQISFSSSDLAQFDEYIDFPQGQRVKLDQAIDYTNHTQDLFCSAGIDLKSQIVSVLGNDIFSNINGNFFADYFNARNTLFGNWGIPSEYFDISDFKREAEKFADLASEVVDQISDLNDKIYPTPESLRQIVEEIGVEVPDEYKVYVPSLPAPSPHLGADLDLKKRKDWSGLEFGDQNSFATFGSAYYEIRGSETKQAAAAEAKAGAYVLGQAHTLIRARGSALASKDQFDYQYELKVVGLVADYTQFDQKEVEGKKSYQFAKVIPANGGYEELIKLNTTLAKVSVPFAVGPIPGYLTAELQSILSLDYRVSLHLLKIHSTVRGNATAKARLAAAFGVEGLTSAGVSGDVDVINANLPVSGQAAINFDKDGAPVLGLDLWSEINYELIKGTVNAFIEYPWPSIKMCKSALGRYPCGFEMKQVRQNKNLYDWAGQKSKHMIFHWGIEMGPYGTKSRGSMLDQDDLLEAAILNFEVRKGYLAERETELIKQLNATFQGMQNDFQQTSNILTIEKNYASTLITQLDTNSDYYINDFTNFLSLASFSSGDTSNNLVPEIIAQNSGSYTDETLGERLLREAIDFKEEVNYDLSNEDLENKKVATIDLTSINRLFVTMDVYKPKLAIGCDELYTEYYAQVQQQAPSHPIVSWACTSPTIDNDLLGGIPTNKHLSTLKSCDSPTTDSGTITCKWSEVNIASKYKNDVFEISFSLTKYRSTTDFVTVTSLVPIIIDTMTVMIPAPVKQYSPTQSYNDGTVTPLPDDDLITINGGAKVEIGCNSYKVGKDAVGVADYKETLNGKASVEIVIALDEQDISETKVHCGNEVFIYTESVQSNSNANTPLVVNPLFIEDDYIELLNYGEALKRVIGEKSEVYRHLRQATDAYSMTKSEVQNIMEIQALTSITHLEILCSQQSDIDCSSLPDNAIEFIDIVTGVEAKPQPIAPATKTWWDAWIVSDPDQALTLVTNIVYLQNAIYGDLSGLQIIANLRDEAKESLINAVGRAQNFVDDLEQKLAEQRADIEAIQVDLEEFIKENKTLVN